MLVQMYDSERDNTKHTARWCVFEEPMHYDRGGMFQGPWVFSLLCEPSHLLQMSEWQEVDRKQKGYVYCVFVFLSISLGVVMLDPMGAQF